MAVLGLPVCAANKDNKPAYTWHDDYCFTYEDNTICYENRGVVVGVTTPDGDMRSSNVVFVGNGTSSYQEMDPSGNTYYSDALRYHTQGVSIGDVLREMGQSFTTTLAVGDASCTTTYQYQFANGRIVVDRSTSCY